MKKISLLYNPFLVETVITINDKPISAGGELKSKCGLRLQTWLYKLFPLLEKECNDDITVKFKGTELDYNDIVATAEEYKKHGGVMRIEFDTPKFVESGKVRLEKLIQLFDNLQSECPFEDLKTQEIKNDFQRAISANFEVSIIATMSSGKSTLLNALLRRELLPSKNAACTATIAHIEDEPSMTNFTAKCFDAKNNLIAESDNLTADQMNSYNDTENITDIFIKGDIPFTDDANMKLVLLDTPGPNNSRTDEHQLRTYRVIKSDAMPMVLYIINATQLFVNDDKYLLEAVAKAVKEQHGKQARDRFIFVINKTDMLDTDKGESVQKTIDEAKKYFQDIGIEDANIYPLSAEFAKLIRMNSAGQELTRAQKRNLNGSADIFEIPEMHLEKYAPLSLVTSRKIEEDLHLAESKGDKDSVTLIHTGVPALEAAIVEYMNKYALTNKIKEAVDTFKNKIDEKNIMSQLEAAWQENDAERKLMNEQLQIISAQLEQGQKAASLKTKIEQIDISKDIVPKIRAVRAKCDSGFTANFGSDSTDDYVTPEIANKTIHDMKNLIPNLQNDIKTDLEKIINESIIGASQKILDEYKSYVQGFIKSSSIIDSKNFFNLSTELLTVNLPSVDRLVEKYTETKIEYESVEIGTKTVSDSTWYKPWTWFDSHEEPVIEEIEKKIELTEVKCVIDEYFTPLRMNMNDNIQKIGEQAKEQAEEFKEYFIGELEKLDDELKKKIGEMEKTTQSKEELEAKIQQDSEKKQWLENFQQQLDSILKI